MQGIRSVLDRRVEESITAIETVAGVQEECLWQTETVALLFQKSPNMVCTRRYLGRSSPIQMRCLLM